MAFETKRANMFAKILKKHQSKRFFKHASFKEVGKTLHQFSCSHGLKTGDILACFGETVHAQYFFESKDFNLPTYLEVDVAKNKSVVVISPHWERYGLEKHISPTYGLEKRVFHFRGDDYIIVDTGKNRHSQRLKFVYTKISEIKASKLKKGEHIKEAWNENVRFGVGKHHVQYLEDFFRNDVSSFQI